MIRRLSVLVVVAVLGALIIAVAIASPTVLRDGAERQLRAAGFAQAQVARAGIGPDGLHFADIRPDPGGAVRVDELVIPWSLDLMRGVVGSATLVGARIVIDTRGTGTGAGTIGWGAPPPVALVLRGAVLEVRTATGAAVLTFDATATPDARALRFAGRGTFRHDADPAFVVPLATAIAVDWTADGLAVRGRLTDAASGLDVTLAGGVQPAAGTGDLRLTGAPLRLAPEHPLAGVAPALARTLAALAHDVAGRLTLEGRLAWGPREAATTTARVRLDDVGFASTAGTVAGLSGTLAFADLAPLRLDGAQHLRVAHAEAGIALADLDIELRQNAAGAPVVQRASAAALGGRVEAGPITASLAHQRTTVRFRDVAVTDVLALGGPAGLSGSGRLSGELAVLVTADQVALERGELASTAPGVLAYRPADPGSLGDQAATMLAVLSDFHYERLTITFERGGGAAAGGLAGRMRIEGHNPSFEEGRAVVLNVNLAGDVEQAVQAALGFYRLPAEIMRAVGTLEPRRR